jgi:hypothetical protein
MNFNSSEIQQYVRISLYWIFGALGSYGFSVPDSSRAVVVSVAGSLATLAWTMYGTRLNGLLEQARAKAGVQEINVKVDDSVIKPSDITANTSAGISAKAA